MCRRGHTFFQDIIGRPTPAPKHQVIPLRYEHLFVAAALLALDACVMVKARQQLSKCSQLRSCIQSLADNRLALVWRLLSVCVPQASAEDGFTTSVAATCAQLATLLHNQECAAVQVTCAWMGTNPNFQFGDVNVQTSAAKLNAITKAMLNTALTISSMEVQ